MPIYLWLVLFDFIVRVFPNRKGTSQQLSPFICKDQDAAATVC